MKIAQVLLLLYPIPLKAVNLLTLQLGVEQFNSSLASETNLLILPQ